jgi:soluble lytic murein transglycosylase
MQDCGGVPDSRRLRRLAASGIAPALVAALLALPPAAQVHAESDGQKPIRVAEVPLPRANPMRAGAADVSAYVAADAGADDPIAALLAGDDTRVTEDSDAPEAGFSPAPVAPPKKVASASKVDLSSVGLRYALKFLDDGDPAAATAAAYALPSPVDTKIIDWLVATSGRDDVPASRIADVWRKLADWPGQTLLQIRFEQALVREDPPAAAVIQAFAGRKPVTDGGTRLLARAYVAAGRKQDAADLVRRYWREQKFTDDMEASLRKEFGSLLTAADYKARLDRLLYEEQSAAALRNAKYLDKNAQALAAFVVAVSDKKAAEKLMAAVPAAKRGDPLYVYSKIRLMRRAEKYSDAAALMLSAPRDPKLIDGDAWWVERRLIARALLDKGDPRTAYKLAAGHSAESSASIAEAEFHAGWFALEFLGDPATAKKHFAVIQSVSSMPLSQSRAEYWLGRAAEKAGDMNEATMQYRRAAAYPTTFYGQLALAKLGVKKLPIAAPTKPDEAVKARFNAREYVQVIRRLDAANRGDKTDIFYRALAEELTDPAELALLAGMAESDGNHQLALQIGKTAASRGLPCDTLAFPTAAIPASAKTRVEKPMVYAIARQESAFNPGAISRAGARGLLQLMPATAKQTAKAVGLPYSQSRLTSDPGYNATLGAAHLGDLFDGFGGSYVMTFAAYNAGSSRVRAWIEAYGDPRDPKVDVVNWIERIPFSETRNYVQRIMENLQVYRARLGQPELTIVGDLKRGKRT